MIIYLPTVIKLTHLFGKVQNMVKFLYFRFKYIQSIFYDLFYILSIFLFNDRFIFNCLSFKDI